MTGNHTAQAIRLIAQREIVTRAKTRSFLISTALMMAVIIIGTIVWSALSGGSDTERVGLVSAPSATASAEDLTATIEALGTATGTDIEVVALPSAEQARTELTDGDLEAVLVASDVAGRYEMLSENGVGGTIEGVLRTAVDQVTMTAALAERGVDATELPAAEIVAVQIEENHPDTGQRIVIALVGMILLTTAIMTGGSMVAVGVVEEKTSRVVEILLATIKPLHLLWGKIIGIGVIALAQVLLLGVTALIAGWATGLLTIAGTAVGMFAAVIVWFVLGFLFFATLFAATGAMVSRQEELNASSAPLTVLAMAMMYAGIFGIQALDSTLVQTLSWIPPFSAALMPVRIATGDTDAIQIIGTLVLMVLACAIATAVAARIYQRSILRTGSRIKWGEALSLRG